MSLENGLKNAVHQRNKCPFIRPLGQFQQWGQFKKSWKLKELSQPFVRVSHFNMQNLFEIGQQKKFNKKLKINSDKTRKGK